MVREVEVAPPMLAPPLRHGKVGVGGAAPAAVKLAEVPVQRVMLAGSCVTAGQTGTPGLIVRMPVADVATWPSGLVTVIVRAPVAAPAVTVRLSVMCVGSVKVMLLTVTPPKFTA